jgi:hypothetical protein
MAGLLASMFQSKTSYEVKRLDLGTHAGGVSALVASSKFVVSAAKDEQDVRIWDVSNQHSGGRLQGHSKKIQALAIHPDESKIASATEDGDLRVWDVTSMKELGRFQRAGVVHSMAFYPQENLLAVAGDDESIAILDVFSGREERVLRIDPEAVKKVLKEAPKKFSKIIISPKQTHLAAVGGGTVVIWDLAKEGTASIHLALPHQLFSACFSSNGDYLAAGGGHYKVSISFGGASAGVQISGFAGVLFLLDILQDRTHTASTAKMVFEDVAFSADATKVFALAAIPPAADGLKQTLHIYSLEALRGGSVEKPEAKLEVGNGPLQITSAFDLNGSLVALANQENVFLFQIKENN